MLLIYSAAQKLSNFALSMLRYFLELRYKGSAYHGWQIQPRQMSVQQKIQEAMSVLFKEDIPIVGCGRTDTGVHAMQYYAHFEIAKPLTFDISHKLNALLPNDIVILRHFEVDSHMHARFDALERTYKYFVHTHRNPFLLESSYYLKTYQPDFNLMNTASKLLIGEYDFSTFEKKGSDNESSVCKVSRAEWTPIDSDKWVLTITSNRFLRNMVRSITGANLLVGIGRLSVEDLQIKFNSKETIHNNLSVPAHGLFLWSVAYPFDQQ